MFGERKEFPVSDLKLERLRAQGVFPFSKLLMQFAVALGLALGLLILMSTNKQNLVSFAKKGFSGFEFGKTTEPAGLQTELPAELKTAFDFLFSSVFSVIIALVIVLLIVGFLQTRFFISFSLLRFDFTRLVKVNGNILGSIASNAGRGFLIALISMCWLSLAGLLLLSVFDDKRFIIGLSGSDLFPDYSKAVTGGLAEFSLLFDKLPEQSGQKIYYLLFVAVAFSFFLGLLSYFYEVYRFRREQRMSRAEVEDERREVETSPESRGAREQFRAG